MGRGRPPTSLGTWGTIRTTRVREGVYRARTRIRDRDGVTRGVTATGTTIAAADRALREKLVDRATPTQQAITADTTIATLAALWLTFLRDEGRIDEQQQAHFRPTKSVNFHCWLPVTSTLHLLTAPSEVDAVARMMALSSSCPSDTYRVIPVSRPSSIDLLAPAGTFTRLSV